MKVIFLFAAAFLFSIITLCARSQEFGNLPRRGICAHRGAMDTHPENTIAAFKEAMRLGAQMIELDVRLTKDRQLVILHDGTVDRTTDGAGDISTLTFDQVRQLDAGGWLSPEFKGEKIPTLQEAFKVMPDSIWLNIHLKGDFEMGALVANVLVENNKIQQSFLACGYGAAKGAKTVDKNIKICNMERQPKTADYVSQTIQRRAEFIQFYKTPVDDSLKQWINELKAHGIFINYCCTDDKEMIQKLFELGVDFILVNHLGSAKQFADSLGI